MAPSGTAPARAGAERISANGIGPDLGLRSAHLGSNRSGKQAARCLWLIPHRRAYHDAIHFESFPVSPGRRMSMGNGRPLGRPPHKNSKAAPLQPGDEVGAYTYAQWMDRRYVAAAEEAICLGLERRTSAFAEQGTGASDRARGMETVITALRFNGLASELSWWRCSWHDALGADQLPGRSSVTVPLNRADVAGDLCLSALQRQQLPHHRAPGRLRRAGDQLRSQQD